MASHHRAVTGITRAQAIRALKLAADGSCLGARDAALLAVMSDGMLSATEAAKCLVGDATFYPDGTTRLRIGAGADSDRVKLRAGSTRLLRRWLAWVDPKSDDRLFQQLDHRQWPVGPISRRAIVAVIRERAEAAGTQGNFASQSLRIGAAESMAEGGAKVAEIQRAARWKSWTYRSALRAAGEGQAKSGGQKAVPSFLALLRKPHGPLPRTRKQLARQHWRTLSALKPLQLQVQVVSKP